MGKLRELYSRFNNLNLDTELYLAVINNQEVAIKLNKDQLDDGEYSDGANLPEYSDVSVEVFGKEPGPFTLDDTGAFRAGFEMKGSFDAFNITSYDPKTSKIIDITHPDIFGLNKSNGNQEAFNKVVNIDLVKNIRNHLKI